MRSACEETPSSRPGPASQRQPACLPHARRCPAQTAAALPIITPRLRALAEPHTHTHLARPSTTSSLCARCSTGPRAPATPPPSGLSTLPRPHVSLANELLNPRHSHRPRSASAAASPYFHFPQHTKTLGYIALEVSLLLTPAAVFPRNHPAPECITPPRCPSPIHRGLRKCSAAAHDLCGVHWMLLFRHRSP